MSRKDRRSTRKLSPEEKQKAVEKIIELRDQDGLNWTQIGAQFTFSASTARNFYNEAKKEEQMERLWSRWRSNEL